MARPRRLQTRRETGRPQQRLYVRRDADGTPRFYADLRTLGGAREALKARGERRATSDPEVAEKLLSDRVSELLKQRSQGERVAAGIEKPKRPGLKAFAAAHLEAKAKAGRVTAKWLARTEAHLDVACSYFGPRRELDTITVRDVEAWLDWLAVRPGRGGNKSVSGGTRKHYLHALSNLYRRASGEGVVPPGYNPASAVMEKPAARRLEARWLEVHEAALLLEAARTFEPVNPWQRRKPEETERHEAMRYGYALLAVFLLTGGRAAEVLGLLVSDVNFDRQTVTFRPHPHRRIKTLTSHRVVPLWPQLEEILREHLKREKIAGGLLFPSPVTGKMLVEVRKLLDAVGERAGWKPGEIRCKDLRHTYCSARLQSLDGGAPVSPFTVGRELGHGGMSLVNRVYGHLGTVRLRSEVVEYRPTAIRHIQDQQVRAMFIERLRKVAG